ncbi:MAG: hypothetical protein R2991_16165 [Thermoanaerobaculia bacterium]
MEALRRHRLTTLLPAGLLVAAFSSLPAAAEARPDPFAGLSWRNLGPFRTGSWITDVAVPAGPGRDHLYTLWVAARNGGVWKSTNNGTTFQNVTDDVGIASVGSLAIAPSDPQVVWVGTGDSEVARSSYAGTGVWRSLDGGGSWEHRGLSDAHHVARIRIHPRRADTVWVAAMGHLFSENAERGVFKTRDGGATWRHVLDLGPRIGVVDLALDPDDPDTLYAAAYEKVRLPWHFEAGGPGSGVYKSVDGGESWRRLGGGLPGGRIGRIGLAIFPGDPRLLYAVIENLAERPPTAEEAAADREDGREPRTRTVGGELWASTDGGESWEKRNAPGDDIASKAAYSFNEIRVHPTDPDTVFVTSESLAGSTDGGRTWSDITWPPTARFASMFGDVRTFWIDPLDPQRMILGSDGGLAVSYDGGTTADAYSNLPLGEVYGVALDRDRPYHVYAGLQDHETWMGPVNSWSGSVGPEDWVIVGLWDGMVVDVSPDGRWVYSSTQFGHHLRTDRETGTRVTIEPTAPEGEPEYRFTWTAPLALSPHDPDVVWVGAQRLLRSPDRGTTWEAVSPDLTTDDADKIAGEGHIQYCTITTLAESERVPGLLWVGTDDGRVWTSHDLGASWVERTDALAAAGAPADRWVSRVLPSRFDERTAYVAKSGYRRDDFTPYLYRTRDGGASWEELSSGLPRWPISVVREDPRNPDLLFVGNDRGVWSSLDGGASWEELPGLPPVPVRDLAIHPDEHDLVVGTYGRGLWIADVHALEELTPAVRSAPAHLFTIEPKPVRWSERASWGAYELSGDRILRTPNEPDGLVVSYWLGASVEEAPEIVVRSLGGEELARLPGDPRAGLHTVVWETGETDVQPGEVWIELAAAGTVQRRRARLLPTPPWPLR